MKIVFITACGVEERYLIEKVSERYPDTHVLRPMFWKEDRPQTIPTNRDLPKLSRKLLDFRARLVAYYLKKKLFRGRSMPLPKKLTEISAWKINTPETAAMVKELAPDVIITSDAPILKPIIFNQARLLPLNIHWGVAPAYRGNHTNFWALYRRDYENIGATLHRLSEGIDRGEVFARIYPALSPWDHEVSITQKVAELVPSTLLELLETLEKQVSLRSAPQTGSGTLFLNRQQTFGAVLKCTVQTFFWRPRRTEQRIDRFYI